MNKKWMISLLTGSICMAALSGTVLAADVSDASAEEEVFSESITEDSTEVPEEAVSEGSTEEEITVPDRPEYKALDYVTLGQYTGFTMQGQSTEVTDDEVMASLNSSIGTDYYTEVTDRPVQEGDVVNIDYTGKKDGQAFDGGTASGYDLTIGSNTFIDGFEDGLIGANTGDTLDLNLTFPDNYYSEDLAGQDVVFTVTINSIREFPEITDDLINEITGGSYTTVDDYKTYLKDQLVQQKEDARESAIRSQILTKLMDTCTVDSDPDGLSDYYTALYKRQYQTYASYYGINLKDMVESSGMTMDDFNTELEKEARVEMDQELILEAIEEKEKLEISDEEYDQSVEEQAEKLGYTDVDQFKESVDQEEFTRYLLMEKALKFVEDSSVITEEGDEAATEGAEAVTEGTEAAGGTEEAAESSTEQ